MGYQSSLCQAGPGIKFFVYICIISLLSPGPANFFFFFFEPWGRMTWGAVLGYDLQAGGPPLSFLEQRVAVPRPSPTSQLLPGAEMAVILDAGDHSRL